MTRAEIAERIALLKKERNAVILAHNYQIGEVQDVADILGDSLELSRKAAATEADVIVFCGVHFMAETAAILSPRKQVLLPELRAGCPMAAMITADELREWKLRYPGRPVVCYVNTSAEVKAECNICCTSSNALRVVESLPDPEILFVPDKNLAAYIARTTKKKITAWDGYCYVHNEIFAGDIRRARDVHPGAEVWAHPECRPEVIDLADRILSTGKMATEARAASARTVILATESGIIYRLKKENPGKDFFPAKETSICSNMKKISLDKVLRALEENVHQIRVPEDIAARARTAIEKMIAL